MFRVLLPFLIFVSFPALAEEEAELSNYVYPIVSAENRDKFKFRHEGQTIYNRDAEGFERNEEGEWQAEPVEPGVKAHTKLFREGKGTPE